MKEQEDFEFSSNLTVQEALQRLKLHTEGRHAKFTGSIMGNQFFLHHDGEDKNTTKDDPQISGYILQEGEGCKVFARIRVAEQIEASYRFSMFQLIFLGALACIILWNSPTSQLPIGRDSVKVLIYLISFVATGFGAWYLWKKHEEKGKPEAIDQFRQLLAPKREGVMTEN